MSEHVKVTDEELNILSSIQNQWNQLIRQYGELQFQKHGIDAELKAAYESLDQLDIERFNQIKQLQERYGRGQVDLTTGEFIPDSSSTL